MKLFLLKILVAELLGIPEQNPEIDRLVTSLTKNKLFSFSTSFDPIAQDPINPFLQSGFKQEVAEPEPYMNRQTA